MNKRLKSVILIILATALAFCCVGCNIDALVDIDELDYGDYERADAESDSWLQIDPDDEDVEITWWVDTTSWDFYQIASLIYKRTGVRVNFQKALKNDGSELSTMIAGNNLYDVVTITDYSVRNQLAKDGYAYSIDKLAELYAPTLLDRIGEDYYSYFASDDGHLYGLMNNYFSDADLESYSEAGGNIRPLYSVIVRQDYLNAYLEYRKSRNSEFDETAAMTGSEFIDMCMWVKNEYNLPNSNPTVMLDEFLLKASKSNINSSLSAITEYFCVPVEDSEGNLLYEYEQPEFMEVLKFFNRLFNDKLVLSSNFSYSSTNISSNFLNGLPFAFIGRSESYISAIAKYSGAGYDSVNGTFDPSHEYVSIVITNEKGDAPLVVDKSGRGLRFSMITNNCKRIDRVIKVFDYLMSEQGQRECYYGETEGEYYNYVLRPGESETVTVNGKPVEVTYKYGKIEWTDKAKSLLGSQSGSGWYNAGIKQISLLANPMYPEMTSVYGAGIDTYQWYKSWDMLCGLMPYTYSKTIWDFDADADDPQYNRMADVQADIEGVWISYLPSIIMAANEAQLTSLYEAALEKVRKYGLDEWMAFRNKYYKQYKEKMGVVYGWPKADPSYVAPETRLLGFYDDYRKDMPEYFVFN